MADQVMINGVPHLADAKGHLVPETMIKPHELLEDQLVSKMIEYARDLSAQIGRFKGHCFDDVASFMELLASNYGMTKRGAAGKGNVTFSSFDGRRKVTIQVADQMTFGPGLQVAKQMVDNCLEEWSADARPELRVLVQEAFRADKAGQVSTDAVFRLLRMEIVDAAWQRAMKALRESVRIEGSKSYIRFHERDASGRWKAITIDLASAVAPDMAAPSKAATGELPLIKRIRIGDRFQFEGPEGVPDVWICTDVGSRVIIAIRMQAGWSAGPPYALAEAVFDERDQKAIRLLPAEAGA